jgi:hypothetical protein
MIKKEAEEIRGGLETTGLVGLIISTSLSTSEGSQGGNNS